MANNSTLVERIETLSNEVRYLVEEMAELAQKVKDPVFVDKSEIWLSLMSEALESCEESIEEYNDYSADPFENIGEDGEFDYDASVDDDGEDF